MFTATNRLTFFHTFAFAIYWILSLYAENMSEVSLLDVLWVILVLILVVGCALACLLVFIKDKFIASLLISAGVAIFFSYEFFIQLKLTGFIDFPHMHPIARHIMRVSIYFGAPYVLAVYLIVRIKKNRAILVRFANIFSLFLLAVVFALIIKNSIVIAMSEMGPKKNVTDVDKIKKLGATQQENRDVYYIILDGYGGNQALDKFYHFSNDFFVNELKRRGFYVATKSRANYIYTMLSLPASLNINYIHSDLKNKDQDIKKYLHLREKNTLLEFFNSRGYQCIQLSSGADSTKKNAYADINYNTSLFSDFFMALMSTSAAAPLTAFFEALDKKQAINKGFEVLGEISFLSRKTFTFAHFMIPHPPYALRLGEEYSVQDLFFINANKNTSSYINEIKFVNHKILIFIDTILKNSKTLPIIIIQGDHGPRPLWRGDPSVPQKIASPEMATYLEEITPIMNAYFLPEGGGKSLYESISPVNSFRVVLNQYYGQELELLDDKTFIESSGKMVEV